MTGLKNRQDHGEAILRLFDDLLDWGGATAPQMRAFFDDAFLPFMRFFLFGDPQVKTAIQNDTTHTWLDDAPGGVTIRQRMLDRLENIGVE